jgi:nucleotide-binding universal stress UspA family protein
MIRTILIALDGSKLAEQAIPIVSAVAARTGADVVLATAIVRHDRWIDGPSTRTREQEEEAAARAYLRPLARHSEQELSRGCDEPAPAPVIGTIADEEVTDPLPTTHGRSASRDG